MKQQSSVDSLKNINLRKMNRKVMPSSDLVETSSLLYDSAKNKGNDGSITPSLSKKGDLDGDEHELSREADE